MKYNKFALASIIASITLAFLCAFIVVYSGIIGGWLNAILPTIFLSFIVIIPILGVVSLFQIRKSHERGKFISVISICFIIFFVLTVVYESYASLYRPKGADAGTKSSLVNVRTRADDLYTENTPPSFAGLCTDTKVNSFLQSAKKTSKSKVVTRSIAEGGSDSAVTCHVSNSNDAWAIEAPLRTGKFWCMDSSGASVEATGFHLGPFVSTCLKGK